MEGKKLYLYFMDYQKAFDRLKHNKLETGDGEGRCIRIRKEINQNLYWRQHSAVKWDYEVSREVKVEKGRGMTGLCNITLALQPTQGVYAKGSHGKV